MSNGHSDFGPSSLSRIMACPASYSRCRGVGSTESPAAAEGTLAHAILANILEGRYTSEQWIDLPDGVDINTLPDDMLPAVMEAVKHVNNIRAEWSGEELVEEQLSMEVFNLPEVWGTADYIHKGLLYMLTVMDYKHGANVYVDEKDNPQLLAYAAMAAGKDLFKYELIRMVIVQPRCFSGGGDIIREHLITPEELYKWIYDELHPAIKLAQSDDVLAFPGMAQCRWCKAKMHCPEFAAFALDAAKLDFEQVSNGLPLAKIPIDPDPETLANIFTKLPALKSYIRAVESAVYQHLTQGREVPGYKLVKGRRKRVWVNEQQTVECLTNELCIGKDDLYEAVALKSPSKVEKLLSSRKSEIKHLIGYEGGKPIIVPQDDKREALTVAADFEGSENDN